MGPRIALALSLAAALASGPALADDVPSIPASVAPSSVSDQIDAYLRSSPALILPQDKTPGAVSSATPRKLHGEVSLGVGSNGYRSLYARTDFPVRESSLLSVAIEKSSFDGRFGSRRIQALGLSFGSGDAVTSSQDRSCAPDRAGWRVAPGPGPGFARAARCYDDMPAGGSGPRPGRAGWRR
ncbi:MAG: hypothetical protein Q8M88_07475 [Phenylobacterium sp.]|uniref:hypothetical protein n=1 Tax=Phenylobacterium sp. TaxID=1871053 RepID=UPI00273738DA|nr:hypothetical protein [Phenylobacterium sp.]MDP3174258.1 hypothetical protein [Phenylobacterium sp.]